MSGVATLAILTNPTHALAVLEQSSPGYDRSAASQDVITLFLCGDVMTGRGIDQVLPHPGDPRICEPHTASATTYVKLAEHANGPIPKPVTFAYIWGHTLEELERRAPDLRIINLETSITTSEDCTDKGISYRMSPANIPCLTAAKIDCCVLANNHVLDWGRTGLIETLKTLDSAKIKRAGAGHGILEAEAPAILEVSGKGRVLVFSFGSVTSGIPRDWAAAEKKPGVNLLKDLSNATLERIGEQLYAARRPGDISVASIHWGENWGYHIPAAQRNFAHGLIDEAGVDIVYGHSSHHPKGIEVYKERAILYGCGDFLDDYEGISGYEKFRDDLVLMYFLSLAPSTRGLVRCDMVPLQIRNFRLSRASKEDARWLRDVLNREGEQFGTRVEAGEDNALVLDWR